MKTVLVLILAAGCIAVASAADIPVKVIVDGKAQSYSPGARMRGGTVYVPLREGATSLGATVKWHADTHRAQICTASGCAIIKQTEAITVNGALLLPLRKMGEITGATVSWDEARKTVTITRKR